MGEPDLHVWVDPDRVHQVLDNLISNAVKYGRPDAEIRIEWLNRGDRLEVVVTNHGPGIPAEELPQLFSRFGRTRGARTHRTPGIGLGLYIARGLVEAHGGRIWAESVPGQSTSFHFTVADGASPRPPARRRRRRARARLSFDVGDWRLPGERRSHVLAGESSGRI